MKSPVPFTLRNKIDSDRARRKTNRTLLVRFSVEGDIYGAQFMGGVEFDNLILTSNETKETRFATSADLDRKIVYLSSDSNASLSPDTPEGMAWHFAGMLVGRIASNMRRLRLGGNDPFMVFWKAWNETWDWYEKSYDISKASVSDAMEQGLQLVIDHHPYGPAITELQERARAKIAALCQEKEVLEDVV